MNSENCKRKEGGGRQDAAAAEKRNSERETSTRSMAREGEGERRRKV